MQFFLYLCRDFYEILVIYIHNSVRSNVPRVGLCQGLERGSFCRYAAAVRPGMVIEAVMGMLLLLRVRPQWSTIAAVAFLVTVSVIFAYGVAFKGIQDCGCFGALSRLYTGKPWMTFVRNAVFCLIAVPALIMKNPSDTHLSPKLMAAMLVGATACFICGLSMRKSFVLPQWDTVKTDSRSESMRKLNAIYPFSADSSYVVYLFSFTCAHCQNSFANLQQYHQLQVVDKVIGIAIENEEALNDAHVYDAEIYHEVGDVIPEVKSSLDRSGHVIVIADTVKEAIDRAESMIKEVKMITA